MSVLEREIIDKFRLLDKEAQERVRQQIEQEAHAEELEPMSTEEWLERAIAFGKRNEWIGDFEIPESQS